MSSAAEEPGSTVRRPSSMIERIVTAFLTCVLLAACGAGAATVPVAAGQLDITAVAGPTCPVETDPPTPGCEAAVVPGAVIIVMDADGNEVGRATTDADGHAVIEVDPGDLTLVPQPVEGLMGTAEAVSITVTAGATSRITIGYDTGIR